MANIENINNILQTLHEKLNTKQQELNEKPGVI